jgi:hypothetical protein
LKNSKLQHPSSREIPKTKLQNNFWRELDLKIGASPEFGAWNLALLESRLLSRRVPQ